MVQGFFITFEGGEGVGKTTQARRLAERLKEGGRGVVLTREPGGTREGEEVRRLLLDLERDWDPLAELLLVTAARVQHVNRLIRPALAEGKTVICDRYVDSTWAYQGAGKGVAAAHLACCESMLGLLPHLTLLLDADPAALIGRKEAAGDRFEREDEAFFARVRTGFLERARRFPERIVIVPALGSEEEVAQAVARAVEERLGIAL